MTKYEKHLWYDFLTKLPLTVHRQKIIGNYIVDFYIAEAKLIVEVDGGGHGKPDKKEHDTLRTKYLNGLGFDVVRYTNFEIFNNFEGVCRDIARHLGKPELFR